MDFIKDEDIERLGDLLKPVVELAKNMWKIIKKKEGVHSYNVELLNTLRGLVSAEEWYTEFHTYYLEEKSKRSDKNESVYIL